MEGKTVLPPRYVNLGFKVSGFGSAGSIIKFRGKMVFVISSGLVLRYGLVSELCEAYLKKRYRNGVQELISNMI